MSQALHHKAWLKDVTSPLTTLVLIDYIRIRMRTDQVVLRPGLEDTFAWRWTASGKCTVASAYQALFYGQTVVMGGQRTLEDKSPKKVSILLLAMLAGPSMDR